MAANDELPRGLTLSTTPAAGVPASIVFPASNGIAWVLTDIQAWRYLAGAVGPDSKVITPTSNGLALTATAIIEIATGSTPQNGDLFLGSWSGQILGSNSQDLTVKFNSADANDFQRLVCVAYPI